MIKSAEGWERKIRELKRRAYELEQGYKHDEASIIYVILEELQYRVEDADDSETIDIDLTGFLIRHLLK